jgi:hypothetical protein
MKKSFLFLLSLTILSLTTVEARVYKGQKEYIKKCKSCHDNGQELAYSKKKRDWKKMMKNKGEPLAKLHLDRKQASDSWDYFQSKAYTKKSKDLKDFLMEYAKDSGNVPACD